MKADFQDKGEIAMAKGRIKAVLFIIVFVLAVAIGCNITDLFYSETEDTAEELPANDNKAEPIQEVELENPIIQTETFCPHCGKRVKVGVVLMEE